MGELKMVSFIRVTLILLMVLAQVHESSQGCSGSQTALVAYSGSLSSPGFPSAYSNGLRCSWLIQAPSGSLIIQIKSFFLENCCDHLIIVDSGVTLFPGNGNNRNVRSIMASSRSVRISFTTDGSVTQSGWNLTWTTNTTCDEPPIVNNAYLTIDVYQINGSASYQCHPGFNLIGNGIIYCQLANWTAPTCRGIPCEAPAPVTNADVRVTGHQQNDSATYQCHNGYNMAGSHTIYCRGPGWTRSPTCREIPCEAPPSVRNAYVRVTGYQHNDSATYRCLPGYNMSGIQTIYCRHQNWSIPPTCTEVQCDSPPPVVHADITISGYQHNDNATYECHSGYDMYGSQTIHCELSIWTSSPACRAKNCGGAPNILNARIYDVWPYRYNTTFQSTLLYTCLGVGYHIVGSPEITCLEDGMWSSPPECQLNCGPSPFVENSMKTTMGQSYNATTRYQCKAGYELVGDETIHCQRFGHWATPPVCNVRSCGPPPELSDAANLPFSENSVGDRVLYSCRARYEMLGYPIIECLPNLQWSTTPICRRSKAHLPETPCGTPPFVQNSITSSSGTLQNDTIRYECRNGYELIGNATISCLESGSWSNPPTCRALSCGPPPEIAKSHNASIVSGTFIGDEATYICLVGHEINGRPTIRCQPNQQWSTLPQCNQVSCGSPPQLPNSNRYVSGHSYNDTSRYECIAGYDIVGHETIFCESWGYWSTTPECKALSCGHPPDVEHALNVSVFGTSVGDKVSYTCENGYQMTRHPVIECLPNLQWTAEPVCSEINVSGGEVFCGFPPLVPLSTRTVSGQSVNDAINYQCQTEHELIGNETIYCQQDGHWSEPPWCRAKSCGDPPDVHHAPNATIIASDLVGEKVLYECDSGYEIDGQPIIECMSNQQWSPAPECVRIYCGSPPDVQYSVPNTTGYFYNDTTRYKCIAGYELFGSENITCDINGHWLTSRESPECRALSCGTPPEVANSLNVTVFGTSVGDKVSYMCKGGYQTTRHSVIECLPNLLWTAEPECLEIRSSESGVFCGSPPLVPFTTQTVSGQSVNDTTIYQCQRGYELIGDETIYCQPTGHWGLPPRCRALNCGPPPDIQNSLNASIIYGTFVGDKVQYSCQDGYKISGYSTAECQPSQVWTNLPECERVFCGPPPFTRNAFWRASGNYYNDSTRYECETGYEVRGYDTVFCEASGHWSMPPECMALSCGAAPEASNTQKASVFGTSVGDKVAYTCSAGYQTAGHPVIECLPNLQWSTKPACLEIDHPLDQERRTENRLSEENNVGWIVCGIVAAIFVICIVIAVCMLKRRMRRNKRRAQVVENPMYGKPTEAAASTSYVAKSGPADSAYEEIGLGICGSAGN